MQTPNSSPNCQGNLSELAALEVRNWFLVHQPEAVVVTAIGTRAERLTDGYVRILLNGRSGRQEWPREIIELKRAGVRAKRGLSEMGMVVRGMGRRIKKTDRQGNWGGDKSGELLSGELGT